jgi:hypothetical protein
MTQSQDDSGDRPRIGTRRTVRSRESRKTSKTPARKKAVKKTAKAPVKKAVKKAAVKVTKKADVRRPSTTTARVRIAKTASREEPSRPIRKAPVKKAPVRRAKAAVKKAPVRRPAPVVRAPRPPPICRYNWVPAFVLAGTWRALAGHLGLTEAELRSQRIRCTTEQAAHARAWVTAEKARRREIEEGQRAIARAEREQAQALRREAREKEQARRDLIRAEREAERAEAAKEAELAARRKAFDDAERERNKRARAKALEQIRALEEREAAKRKAQAEALAKAKAEAEARARAEETEYERAEREAIQAIAEEEERTKAKRDEICAGFDHTQDITWQLAADYAGSWKMLALNLNVTPAELNEWRRAPTLEALSRRDQFVTLARASRAHTKRALTRFNELLKLSGELDFYPHYEKDERGRKTLFHTKRANFLRTLGRAPDLQLLREYLAWFDTLPDNPEFPRWHATFQVLEWGSGERKFQSGPRVLGHEHASDLTEFDMPDALCFTEAKAAMSAGSREHVRSQIQQVIEGWSESTDLIILDWGYVSNYRFTSDVEQERYIAKKRKLARMQRALPPPPGAGIYHPSKAIPKTSRKSRRRSRRL